jgi:hypothetical protein
MVFASIKYKNLAVVNVVAELFVITINLNTAASFVQTMIICFVLYVVSPLYRPEDYNWV